MASGRLLGAKEPVAQQSFLEISTSGLRQQRTFFIYMLVESGAKVGSLFHQFVFMVFVDYVTGQASVALADTVSCNHHAAGGAAAAKRFTASQNAAGAHGNGPAWWSCKEGRRTEVKFHRVSQGKERMSIIQLCNNKCKIYLTKVGLEPTTFSLLD